MTSPDTDRLLLTRIVIERHLGNNGDEFEATFLDGNGDSPGTIEILGMLELAKMAAMDSGCDCDEDDEP